MTDVASSKSLVRGFQATQLFVDNDLDRELIDELACWMFSNQFDESAVLTTVRSLLWETSHRQDHRYR